MAEAIGDLLMEHLKALHNELRDFRGEFHSETENFKHRDVGARDGDDQCPAKSHGRRRDRRAAPGSD